MNPKISIVTVCYNAEKTIRSTILSVLAQTYNNYEYIIIDGNSTDNTLNIINEYKERIDFVLSEKDTGIYDAMNKGIAIATGDWIIFRNSGDLFLKDNTLAYFLQKPISDDIDILCGDCIYTNDWGCKLQKPACNFDNYKKTMPVLHPATFIRSTLHKSINYDTSFKSSGDYNFIAKCCKLGCKFEYRPIAVSTFPIGGFAMKNAMVTLKENMRIIGGRENGSSPLFDFLFYYCAFIKSWLFNYFQDSTILKHIIRINMIRKGWKSGPYTKIINY